MWVLPEPNQGGGKEIPISSPSVLIVSPKEGVSCKSTEGQSQRAQTTEPLIPNYRIKEGFLPNPTINCHTNRDLV